MNVPPVSVVMPVRNGLPFLDESVASILGQSFGEFEFVIIDDASDPAVQQRLLHWADQDPRIRLVRSDEPLGPARSSQAAVEHSRAPLVARMDADDVAHPDRLARQLELFECEQDAGLVGTLHRIIDERGRQLRGLELWPLGRVSAVPPIAHDSIMFRRELFDRVGGYRGNCDYWEDIDLLARLAGAAPTYIIPKALMAIRYSASGTRFNTDPETLDRAYQRLSAALSDDGDRAQARPEAFVLSGAPRVWAGERPHVLGRLLRSGALRFTPKCIAVLGWALWAELSPASLRAVLRTIARAREAWAEKWIGETRWVAWERGR